MWIWPTVTGREYLCRSRSCSWEFFLFFHFGFRALLFQAWAHRNPQIKDRADRHGLSTNAGLKRMNEISDGTDRLRERSAGGLPGQTRTKTDCLSD
jgi:hypothetical protein